jgi:hypothetical protein
MALNTTAVAPSPMARMPMIAAENAGAFLMARAAKRTSASSPENAPAIRLTSGSRGCCRLRRLAANRSTAVGFDRKR